MEPTFKNGQVIFEKQLNDCDHNDYGIFYITEDDITKVVFKKKILLEIYRCVAKTVSKT